MENEVNLDTWPELDPESPPRRVYFRGNFDSDAVSVLKQRGYDFVDIITLPRSTDEEQIRYLLSKAQAIEEGTIIATAEERRQLSLNMHAFGMLNSKDMKFDVRDKVGGDSVETILDWQKSRHTFKGNSTVDIAGRTPEELRAQQHQALDDARTRAEEKVEKLKGVAKKATEKKKPKKKGKQLTRRSKTTRAKPSKGKRT